MPHFTDSLSLSLPLSRALDHHICFSFRLALIWQFIGQSHNLFIILYTTIYCEQYEQRHTKLFIYIIIHSMVKCVVINCTVYLIASLVFHTTIRWLSFNDNSFPLIQKVYVCRLYCFDCNIIGKLFVCLCVCVLLSGVFITLVNSFNLFHFFCFHIVYMAYIFPVCLSASHTNTHTHALYYADSQLREEKNKYESFYTSNSHDFYSYLFCTPTLH